MSSAYRFDLSSVRPTAPTPKNLELVAAILWAHSTVPPSSDPALSPLTPAARRVLLSQYRACDPLVRDHYHTLATACASVLLIAWGAIPTPIPDPT